MSDAKVLILRTCAADMSSHGGFMWPTSGSVEAPDWDPEPSCSHGLHGWLWGEGDGSLGNMAPEAKWLVVETGAAGVVDLGGKVKFQRGNVIHCGDRYSAAAYLVEHGGHGRAIVAGTATAGYLGTATAGDRGTATAGDRGTATAGYLGTATAGDRGTIQIRWWDGDAGRYRTATAYVGEEGILANTRYRLNAEHKFEVAK